MHIFFSGIGGTGIGPLALIAKQAGFTVSGSDKQSSQYTDYLEKHGIDLYIGQTEDSLTMRHQETPIDWFVYSSAVPLENPQHPELLTVNKLGIKHSKRDEFLQYFLTEKKLQLIAIAGTHGKTSSTAMAIWAAKQLHIPVSYSVGAKLSFGDMGHYDPASTYFIYECDEFDRNFLTFSPSIAVLTKIDWDHHEQFPAREDYIAAFKQFCSQSDTVVAHTEEIDYLGLREKPNITSVNASTVSSISLAGEHNRKNAAGVATALHIATGIEIPEIIESLTSFPGSNRRFECISPNIFSDYAHTPEEISATLQLARELGKEIVVVYEPLTNRRQHYMKDAYKDVFTDILALYWVPSYLAREDPNQYILTPDEFVATLDASAHAEAAQMDEKLLQIIKDAAANNATVVLLAGGGGGSLDEWARKHLQATD
jgi:UDP-N-acetylmuramate--alanine ligase